MQSCATSIPVNLPALQQLGQLTGSAVAQSPQAAAERSCVVNAWQHAKHSMNRDVAAEFGPFTRPKLPPCQQSLDAG